MKRWPVFPRSLRQLVMMAFLLILLPLLILFAFCQRFFVESIERVGIVG